jgi:hypothetical protein
MKYNTITKQVAETAPGGVYEGVDYHGSPPDDVSERAGWVDVTPEIQAQIDADKMAIDAESAATRLATFTPALAMVASVMRRTLNEVFVATFGEHCELNRNLTAEVVFGYYFQIIATRPLTDEEQRAKDILQNGFEALTAWTGDGTIWTIPWEVVP